jgi:hypothetical protein
MRYPTYAILLAVALLTGCQHKKGKLGPAHDRPFPLGQASDAFWETQQTNAEAADFIFYDHEFVGDTSKLTPLAKKHLEQVAKRLEHVPFPIVIEECTGDPANHLDLARKQKIVEQLARLGIPNAEERVVVANAFPEGLTAIEASSAYSSGILSNFGNNSRGGRGSYR